jgi:hypothetical protein
MHPNMLVSGTALIVIWGDIFSKRKNVGKIKKTPIFLLMLVSIEPMLTDFFL